MERSEFAHFRVHVSGCTVNFSFKKWGKPVSKSVCDLRSHNTSCYGAILCFSVHSLTRPQLLQFVSENAATLFMISAPMLKVSA